MFTNILVGLGSMLAGASVALIPYLLWSGKMDVDSRSFFRWVFMIWGALWIGPGIRHMIGYLR